MSPSSRRVVAFEGVGNFRDFGGYATIDGHLRRGVLFRSAHWAQASDADLAALSGYGLSTIVDLRRAPERQAEPCRRWSGFDAEVIENDLEEAFLNPNPGFPMHLDLDEFRARSRGFYGRAAYEARHIDLFRRYFNSLAKARGPVLIHCASGKDRTGILVALTHHLVGVHPDDLRADFLATNALLGPRLPGLRKLAREAAGREVADEDLLARVSVGTDYIEATFASMVERHGSVEGYLEQVLGVDTDVRARLLAQLIA